MWPWRMAALPPMGQWSVFGDHWLEVIWLLGCLLCEWAVCVHVCARKCVYVCVLDYMILNHINWNCGSCLCNQI